MKMPVLVLVVAHIVCGRHLTKIHDSATDVIPVSAFRPADPPTPRSEGTD
jgi:hypothetical protein